MRISSASKLWSVLLLLLCCSSSPVFASVNPNDKAKESILFSSSAADGWEEISRTDEDVWYIDMKSISRQPKGILKVTAKRVPVRGSKSFTMIQGILQKGGKDVKSYAFTETEFEIDCSKDVYRILNNRHFDMKEKEIEAFKYPNSEWKSVEPDSVPEYMKTDLCAQEKKAK